MQSRRKKRKKRKPILYMDTSSWNALWDLVASGLVRRRVLEPFRVMFSSNVLDELAGTPHAERRRSMIDLAHALCHPVPFQHHVEVMCAELLCWHSGKSAAFKDYLLCDPDFQASWLAFGQTGVVPEAVRQIASGAMESAKKEALIELRRRRDAFPIPAEIVAELPAESRREMLDRLFDDPPYFREWCYQNLVQLYELPITRGELDRLDPRSCPATSVEVSYVLCLPFLAATKMLRPHRINRGDLKDMHHAVYAGIADLFVTEEDKMRKILGQLIPDVRSEVLPLREMLTAKCGWDQPPDTNPRGSLQ